MKRLPAIGIPLAILGGLLLATFLLVPNALQRLRNRVLPERDASLAWMRRPLPKGQCTWYACVRAADDGWRLRFDTDYGRHALHWGQKVTNAEKSQTPTVGSLMVLDAWEGNPYGHVAYVEQVSPNGKQWTISHANWAVGQLSHTRATVPIYKANCTATNNHGVLLEEQSQIYPLRHFLTRY